MLPPPRSTTPSAPALLPGPGATACTRGISSVTRRPRWGATPAEKRGNRRLGRLPMSNGSQQGKAHPCESANSCMYNICHPAPGDENPRFAGTFCGIVYRANSVSLYVPHTKPVSPPLCFLQRSPYRLWYDGVAHAPSDRAPGREDTWWPAPMAPSERAAPTPCHAPASTAE
jgi:hypothetical protein